MIPLWMFPMGVVTGNSYVLKPSERVPLTAMRLAELATEAGLPDGVLNIIHGTHQPQLLAIALALTLALAVTLAVTLALALALTLTRPRVRLRRLAPAGTPAPGAAAGRRRPAQSLP